MGKQLHGARHADIEYFIAGRMPSGFMETQLKELARSGEVCDEVGDG